MNVTGSIKSILDMSLDKIMSLSRSDLAKVTGRLVSAGNKRLRRLEKKGIKTPASTYVMKHGGKFSVKGKNLAEVREEFQRAKAFLESETSTYRGYRKWEKKIADTLKESSGIDYNSLSEDEKSLFWESYSKLEELDSANVYGAKYSESINSIYDAIKDGSLDKDNINDWVIEKNRSIYEDTQNEWTSSASPFDLGSNKGE